MWSDPKTKNENMKTVCLYTRKHADGGERERYLADTNMNRARKFAAIDGEKWTNRGLVVGDPEISTAEHEEKEIARATAQPPPHERTEPMKHDKDISPENQADHEIGLEMIRVLKLRRRREDGHIETTHGGKTPCGLARTVRSLDPGHAAMLTACQKLVHRAYHARRLSQSDMMMLEDAIVKAGEKPNYAGE